MNTTRPNSAPAYYLGRPSAIWQEALAPAKSATDRRLRLPVEHRLSECVRGGLEPQT